MKTVRCEYCRSIIETLDIRGNCKACGGPVENIIEEIEARYSVTPIFMSTGVIAGVQYWNGNSTGVVISIPLEKHA